MSIAYAGIAEAAIAALYGANKIATGSSTPPKRRTAAKADSAVLPEAL